ncbi:MAG: DUF2817 domain-containing protein [Pedosphaera sp.]|nr:DUF2817 domain-containing protein [Pedosphaera sp.]
MKPSAATQRLGRNHGRYLGEAIDIHQVLRETIESGVEQGWRQESILDTESYSLLALHRSSTAAHRRIYISSGIHGDEPAGPLAMRQLVKENFWPELADIWLCPCLNPTGFPLNQRENSAGLDLNRQYLLPEAEEIRAHVRWLGKQPSFDVTICLHEDWESNGFYVYELNPENRLSHSEEIVRRVSEVCPIDMSPMIEGREAHGGIVRPSADPRSRPQWPEAFYLLTHKTRLSYTMEAPSDFPLGIRVAALVAGVRATLSEHGEIRE